MILNLLCIVVIGSNGVVKYLMKFGLVGKFKINEIIGKN